MALPTLPPELLLEIISELLASAEAGADPSDDLLNASSSTLGKNSKRGWDHIQSFTLASRNFRNLTLSIWFRRLFLESAKDTEDVEMYFPDLKSTWCRHLHCVQHKSDEYFIWNLSGFKRLTSVRMDWLYIRPIISQGFEEVVPFVNLESSQVKELDIRGVRYPSPMTLKALTMAFVDVVILKLDFLRIWCSLCHTSTIVQFPSPGPTKFLYEDGVGLPLHYARYIHRLTHLEEIFIRLPDFGHGFLSLGLSDKSNEHSWMGECNRCMALMYEDTNFREEWVSKKLGLMPHKGIPYVKPAQLKKVSWSFWSFQSSSSNDGTGYSSDEIYEFDDEGVEEYDIDENEELDGA